MAYFRLVLWVGMRWRAGPIIIFIFTIAPNLTANRCHLGKAIVYDTIGNQSWSSDVRSHTIATVIDRILSKPWPPAVDVGREVPEAMAEEDCVVCPLS